MSEELKKKLFNYEENPPSTVWDQIATALNEEIPAAFPKKLYDAEVTPPEGNWEKIAAVLDTPAADPYPVKLLNLEVEPPAAVWSGIAAALDEEKTLPQIPAKRRINPFIKYAAAACLIGLIAFGAVRIINSSSSNTTTPEAKVDNNKNNTPANTVTLTPEQQQPQNNTEEKPSNNLPEPKVVLASNENKQQHKVYSETRTYMTEGADVSYASNLGSESDFQRLSLRGNLPVMKTLVEDDANRYLMFMNTDGYFIRMSKKLAEALGCLYTNGNSEEYRQCQERVKKWREKIAQSPVTPSADNFMDILDLIKSIENNDL